MKIKAAYVKELEDRDGKVTADSLVAAARDKRHPAHNDLPWDDKIAGHQYRLVVARQIIASVRIMITTSTKTVSCVAYVRDPDAPPRQQGYVNVARLRTETESAREALLTEVSRAQSLLERAREIAVGLGLEADLDAMLGAATDLTSRLRRGPAVADAHLPH